MLTRQRKAMILSALKRDGQVVAKDFAQSLGLSEDTVRRDLREMAAEGLLQRVHGGALPASPAVADLAAKRGQSPDAKRALGLAAARMIRPGQLVFLDGGTTCLELARALPADLRAMVVTHSPTVATALIDHPSVEVALLGGRLFKHSGVCVGAQVLDGIRRFQADLYVMGVTGVHAGLGLTTGDMEEADVKRALSGAAAETLVLATPEKIGAASPHIIGPVTMAQTLMVAGAVGEGALDPFRAAGVGVVRA
ncbi:DeoR/GlpR family DNA-binding transcription regulator [Niveispirillum sp. KHB5.9]|uniref:DeoR/GlpR family DNA-binding transcription regulator n=1 Tax=Niveispirillum sp. KHB5.9 TaxID=3400269 RepID=UPI003A868A71